MHINMGLPTLFRHGRETELSWYRKIDEGPWDGLTTYERVLYPDSWAVIPQLAAAAAVTERVRLWTDVLALPMRNPVLLAKDLATIAAGPEGSYITAPAAGTLNCGAAGLLAAVNGAREAGLDELRLIPTTADPDEIDRARDVLGI